MWGESELLALVPSSFFRSRFIMQSRIAQFRYFNIQLKTGRPGRGGGGGDSHMEWTGMLVENFEFNP